VWIIANVVALAIELVLVFRFLSPTYRALAVVMVLGFPFLFDYTLGGDIITLSIPLMLVVANRWKSIGKGARLRSPGVVQAVCLGLAASICQFPWFVAPFLAVALWRLRSGEVGPRKAGKVVARFFAISGGAALLVNAPFIV